MGGVLLTSDAKRVHRDISEDVARWLQERCNDATVEWPYHPRSNQIGGIVRQALLRDLDARSDAFRQAVRGGNLVAQKNVKLSGRRKHKTLDLVVGAPDDAARPPKTMTTIQEGAVARPAFVLETKACMTAHGKASSRLVDELMSSLDVVEHAAPGAACLGVVVVNCAKEFTSPLNLPGPNVHSEGQIADLIEKLVERVPIGRGGYRALALSLVDFDNEHRALPLLLDPRLVPARSYGGLVAAVDELLAQLQGTK